MKGIFTIVKRKAELVAGEWVAGEVIDTVEKHNNMTYAQYSIFMAGGSPPICYDDSAYVAVSERHQEGPTIYIGSLDKITGARLGAEYTPPNDPELGYWNIRTTINPPPVSEVRNIRCIIVSDSSGEEAHAGVGLDTPCIQTDSEILEVSYRIFVDPTEAVQGSGVSVAGAKYVGKMFAMLDSSGAFNEKPYYPHDLQVEWWSGVKPDISTYQTPLLSLRDRGNTPTGNDLRDGTRTLSTSQAIADNVGSLWGQVYAGNATYYKFTNGEPIAYPGMSAIQSTFSRRALSNLHYLDIPNAAFGTGTVTLNDAAGWETEDDLAERYKIEITGGGASGVATYKFKKQKFFGTLGGSGWCRPLIIPGSPIREFPGVAHETLDGPAPLKHGQVSGAYATYLNELGYGVYADTYTYPEVITADHTGLTIQNINGPYENIGATSSIPLVVASINQIKSLADGTILVADASSGLHRITRPALGPVTAITRLTVPGAANDSICRAVEVKKSTGAIWAIFDKEMAVSTDTGNTWTVYNEGTTPSFILPGVTGGGNADTVGYMSLDQDHVDDRFLIVVPSSLTTHVATSGFWWSRGNNVDGVPFTGSFGLNSIRLFNSTAVRCVGGTWVARSTYSTDTTTRMVSYGSNVSLYCYGPSNFCGVGFGINTYTDEVGTEYILGAHTDRLVGRLPSNTDSTTYDVLIQSSAFPTVGDPISPTARLVYSQMVCYVGKGVYLHTYYQRGWHLRQWVTDEFSEDTHDAWDLYGWTGSEWQLNHSGSKTTHIGAEELIENITVEFTGDFISDEFYYSYIYKGLLKDDATSFDYTQKVLLGNTQEVTDFTPSVVPATPPVGAVTEQGYGLSQNIDTTWFEQGYAGMLGSTSHCAFEQKLVGDFSLSFRYLMQRSGSPGDTYTRAGVGAYGVSNTTPLEYLRIAVDTDKSLLTYTITVRSSTNVILHTESVLDGAETDVLTMQRGGGFISYYRNGTVFYTSSTSITGDAQLFLECTNSTNYPVLKDVSVEYSIDRLYVEIGDGATTGIHDVNYRKTVTSVPSITEVYLDGSPAVLHIDGETEPGPSEVTIMPYSGRLWFNAADAGKAVTGKITYVKKLNLE